MKSMRIIYISILAALMVSACGGSMEASIGGNVSGLANNASLTLVNNGVDFKTINTNGDFTFDGTVASDSAYNVTVNAQPTGQNCTVANGIGTVSSNSGSVTNIQVTCVAGNPTSSAVSVNVSGLAVDAVLILSNYNDRLSVKGTALTASGGSLLQLFPTPIAAGSNYNVQPVTQPAGQTCIVTNGIGQMPNQGSSSPAIVTCS